MQTRRPRSWFIVSILLIFLVIIRIIITGSTLSYVHYNARFVLVDLTLTGVTITSEAERRLMTTEK